MLNLKSLIVALPGCFLLAVGMMFVGIPASPDAEFGGIQVLGVVLVSLAFSVSTLGWGGFAVSALGATGAARWMMAFAAGTLLSSLFALALGSLGFISYGFAWLAVLWIAMGCVSGASFLRTLPFRPGGNKILVGFLAAGLALWFASATTANGTTDPFLYHLLAPRLWTDWGRISFVPHFIAIPQASYWENLMIWGNLLFGEEGGRGLIAGHIFGQLIHVQLGVTLTCAAIYVLSRPLLGDSGWAWLAVLVSLCSVALDMTAFLAKNDYGCAGWALTGLALLFFPGTVFPGHRRRETALGGLFLGVAILAKIVLALPIGAALLVWSAWPLKRERLGEVVAAAGGVLAGMLPEMLRNFALLGDPLFPFFLAKFSASPPWGPTPAIFLNRDVGGPSRDLAWTLKTFWDAQSDVRYFSFLALLFPVVAWKRKELSPGLKLFVAVELAFLVYASWQFGLRFLRWLSPALLINAILAVVVWKELASFLGAKLRTRLSWARILAMALPVVFVYGPVGFDWSRWSENTWRSVFFGNSATVLIRHPVVHDGGDAMAWLRMNVAPWDRVATTGFRLLYFASHMSVAPISDHPALDRATFGSKDPRRVVTALRSFGVRYVLDVAHWNERFYRGSFGPMMSDLAEHYPYSIVFQSPSNLSFIVDLEKLESELFGRCAVSRPSREWDWYD